MRLWRIAALLAITPLLPAGAAPGPASEHLAGKCVPTGDSHLFTLMGYSGWRGMDCASIDIDWTRQIALNDEYGQPFLLFRGKREPGGHDLIIEQIDEGIDGVKPAKGRCSMFMSVQDEPASPRSIECFVTSGPTKDQQVIAFRFTVDEPLPAAGAAVHAAGSCGRAEAIDVVLLMELERQVQKEIAPIHSPPFACDQAVIVGGSSVTLSQGDRPDSRLTFSGVPGRELTRLVIGSVTFADRPPIPAIVGTCLSMRMPDGRLQTSCGAAYREGAETRFISAEFTPQGQ